MGFVGRKPTNAPLTSSDLGTGIVGSTNIADGTIANADIANSTINLTTKVTGTLPVANGGTGLAALGTAAQELRVNSGATALEYYTPTVASSDFVLLATTDVTSATASVSFDGYFSSTYKNYKVIISNAIPATNDKRLYIRFRKSNADITTGNYRGVVSGDYANSSTSAPASASYYNATSMTYITTGALNNTTIWGGLMMEMNLYNPLNTDSYKYLTFQNGYISYDATEWFVNNGTGFLTDNASALSGITFYMNTGNIASGNFKLYGIK